MNLEVGKLYVTREGSEVWRVLMADLGGKYSCLAIRVDVLEDSDYAAETDSQTGRFTSTGFYDEEEDETDSDLMREHRKLGECWIRVADHFHNWEFSPHEQPGAVLFREVPT